MLRVPSSAHLGLGFMVPRQNSDRNEFHKTSAKIPYFHRKFDQKDVGRVRNHIWFVLELGLQSYLVPIITVIAIIFGPHHENCCNHRWSRPIQLGAFLKQFLILVRVASVLKPNNLSNRTMYEKGDCSVKTCPNDCSGLENYQG